MAVIAAAIIAFSVYAYLGTITATNVKRTILNQEESKQVRVTQSLGRYIASDIDGIVLRLQLLAREDSLQKGDLTSDATTNLIKSAYIDISRISAVKALIVIDRNGVYVNEGQTTGQEREYLGSDLSYREYVAQTKETLKPYISSTFEGLTGQNYFVVTTPIINRQTGEYIGLVGAGLETTQFFEHYGNVANIDSQLIVAVDKEGTYMVSARPEFVGQNFFGDYVQNKVQSNPVLYRLYSDSVKSGKLSQALFSVDPAAGERFAVASPVYYNGQQIMTVVTSTPTAALYSQVDSILFSQNVQTYILIAALVAVVGTIVLFLVRWSGALERSVKDRTAQLELANKELQEKTLELEFANQSLGERTQRLERMSQFVAETNEKLAVANRELAVANQQLTEHDALQKQFINIAAHELRTPIQPILGASELLEAEFATGKDRVEITKAELDMLVRNAKRLERLSSDILQVTRIESNKLVLRKERLNLNHEIQNAIGDIKSAIASETYGLGKKNLEIVFESKSGEITIEADRSRILEVLSNLLRNAVKFTSEGKIRIISEISKIDDNTSAVVNVKDTGQGIDQEIMPKLFTKFTTKSEQGTGLGLYISKSIIEAHGGKIWAENNSGEPGATFSFSLPLSD